MANTEGMPDEVMQEMLALPADGPSPSGRPAAAAAPSRRGPMSRAERIRKRDEAMKAQRERQQRVAGATSTGAVSSSATEQVAGKPPGRPEAGQEDDDTTSNDDGKHDRRKGEQQTKLGSQPAFRLPKARSEMMDNWSEEVGAPSATVIRSSRAPSVRPRLGNDNNPDAVSIEEQSKPVQQQQKQQTQQSPGVANANISDTSFRESQRQQQQYPSESKSAAGSMKPVIKSQSIQERPAHLRSINTSHHQQQQAGGKKPSKFLQRRMMQQQKAGGSSSFVGGTAGGFPSLDVPIGTFARSSKSPAAAQPSMAAGKDLVFLGPMGKVATTSSAEDAKDNTNAGNGNSADAMLDGMSEAEIMDGIAEIESALSEKSIAFLRSRGRKKRAKEATKQNQGVAAAKKNSPGTSASSMVRSQALNTHPSIMVDKEREATTLSSIRTEEELDRAYADFNRSGNAILESSVPDVDAPGGKIQDLESATALLRSTSYRQTMLAAKTTCELLTERVAAVRQEATTDLADINRDASENYPLLLPVALRCLLDLPQPHKHEQLHSYVLQSIRCLVELFAHASHRVYTSLDELEHHAASVYQHDFMEDDVPTPPSGACYDKSAAPLSVAQELEDSPVDGALYATNSSAETAKKDGEAFYADPLWTLLSRMRVIPCLSRIIASLHRQSQLPEEITSSICAILSMLSLRSPGAACAIAQHETLLPQLVNISLTPGASYGETKESFIVSPSVALSSLVLLCTLARQSRTVASQTEPFASIMTNLFAILGIPAENEMELAVQKSCLILWRILLRYGLAIPHLSTFISLATPHLSIKNETEFSLTADYLSAFTNVCECAKIITRSKTQSSVRLTGDQADTLAMAGAWLSPHVRKCAEFLSEQTSNYSSFSTDQSNMKLVGARLRFLLSYVAASAPTDILKLAAIEEETSGIKISGADKSSFVSVVSRRTCISSLDAVLKSGLVESSLHFVMMYAYVSEWKDTSRRHNVADADSKGSLRQEASACSLLVAFVSLLSNIVNNESIFDDGQGTAKETRDALSIASDFNLMVSFSLRTISHFPPPEAPSLARAGWIDAAQYSIVKLLCSAKQIAPNDGFELQQVRAMAYALLGRLQVGDEAMAAVLLSQDILFTTPTFKGEEGEALPLQAMLLRELCNSQKSRGQLDHSFKLHKGHGITTAGNGPFGLESLRSEADYVAPPRKADEGVNDDLSDPIIPLGKCWLWQVLSSTVSPPPEASAQQRSMLLVDAAAVIISSLELLSCMEDNFGSSSRHYTAQISAGTKLYHLSNSCLFPEEVLRDEQFESLFSSLFVCITSETQGSTIVRASMAKAYVEACYCHSRINRSKKDEDDAEKEKLLALLDGNVRPADDFSTKEVTALVDFVGDMCSAYTEYGAQYEALNYCMRLLLLPGFPSKARVEVLTKLRGLLHLLTFQNEMGDLAGESMSKALEVALDGSHREPSEVLNAFADALCSRGINDNARRLDAETGGYAYFIAIASLARSYSCSLRSKETGAVEAAKKRMERIDDEATTHILKVADRLSANEEDDGKAVVKCVLDVIVREKN